MEAIILAGGKAERLGAAAEGRPKALVSVGGRALAAYQVVLLASAGVDRVIVSCSAGTEDLFAAELSGLGPEIATAGEPEPLGRGGGIKFAAALREESGDVFALNGDELFDLDLGAMLAAHRGRGSAATVAVTPLRSPFGIVDVDDDDSVTGFREAPELPHWVSCGAYVLGEDALERFPDKGDHEDATFPELAASGRLGAFRHTGFWVTVNTPKDLRRAHELLGSDPALTLVGRLG
jgi:NDP-sugar pyrophosphorylase family protein